MEDNKNPIRGGMVNGLNKFTDIVGKVSNGFKDNKETNCDEIINNFKSMLEDSSSIDKIKSDNELDNRIYEIYDMIKDKYINEL